MDVEQVKAAAERALAVARRYVAAHENWERVFNGLPDDAPAKLSAAEEEADDELRAAEGELDEVSVEARAANVAGLVAQLTRAEAERDRLEKQLALERQASAALAARVEALRAGLAEFRAWQQNAPGTTHRPIQHISARAAQLLADTEGGT